MASQQLYYCKHINYVHVVNRLLYKQTELIILQQPSCQNIKAARQSEASSGGDSQSSPDSLSDSDKLDLISLAAGETRRTRVTVRPHCVRFRLHKCRTSTAKEINDLAVSFGVTTPSGDRARQLLKLVIARRPVDVALGTKLLRGR